MVLGGRRSSRPTRLTPACLFNPLPVLKYGSCPSRTYLPLHCVDLNSETFDRYLWCPDEKFIVISLVVLSKWNQTESRVKWEICSRFRIHSWNLPTPLEFVYWNYKIVRFELLRVGIFINVSFHVKTRMFLEVSSGSSLLCIQRFFYSTVQTFYIYISPKENIKYFNWFIRNRDELCQ